MRSLFRAFNITVILSDYKRRSPEQQLADEDLEFHRPQPKPPGGWPRRDTPEALLRAANHAHDDLRKQERINKSVVAQLDSVRAELLSTKEELRQTRDDNREKNIKLWVMGGVVAALCEIVKFLILHH